MIIEFSNTSLSKPMVDIVNVGEFEGRSTTGRLIPNIVGIVTEKEVPAGIALPVNKQTIVWAVESHEADCTEAALGPVNPLVITLFTPVKPGKLNVNESPLPSISENDHTIDISPVELPLMNFVYDKLVELHTPIMQIHYVQYIFICLDIYMDI